MKNHIDGPGLCAWLEQQGIVLKSRVAQDWRKGRTASVARADRALIHFDEAEIQKAATVSIHRRERPFEIARRWALPLDLVEGWATAAGVPNIAANSYTTNEDRRRQAKARAAA